MITHSFNQGSPEWLAHRATHFNASDAPAMMGCSPYETRTELMIRLKTGIAKTVDAATQRRFDDGHRFEALARPLAEKIVGEELYPVTGTEGRLSASFDGLTLMEDVAFEHKILNEELRSAIKDTSSGPRLPLHYRVQMEQQLHVAGAHRCLFMATKWINEELVEALHTWYEPDIALRTQILAGWKQLHAELETFVPPIASSVEKIVAEPVEALPAVSVRVEGAIVIHENFDAFEQAARRFLEDRLIREPKTDQDFADLDGQIKAMKDAEAALESAEAGWIAQIESVGAAKRRKDMLHKLIRDNRLLSEKLLSAEKERRKGEIVAVGVKALADHVAALNARLGKPYMPPVPADFGGCIRGLKSLSSMEDKVNTELARAKIAANEVADRIDANLKHLQEKASEHKFLFADAASIVLKAPEDLQALVANRIGEHQRQEAAKEEAQRERIRAEEVARLHREAQAEQAARDAEAQRTAQAAITAATTPDPTPAPAPAPQAAAPRRAAIPIEAPAEKATMKLGEINERLVVVSVNAEQLAKLGFAAVVDKGARLYKPSDFPLICEAVIQHLYEVADTAAA